MFGKMKAGWMRGAIDRFHQGGGMKGFMARRMNRPEVQSEEPGKNPRPTSGVRSFKGLFRKPAPPPAPTKGGDVKKEGMTNE